ncbi:MAG: carbohydrate binding domain-containing protein, partial [Chitinivibrionales bacterium]
EELAVFVGEYLGPTLERAGLDTRIIAPEVINWGSLKPYGDALLNSSDAVEYCDVIASHSYGDEPTASRGYPYELVVEKGKELWETEYGFDQFAGDESMTPGIAIAKQMHGQIVNGPISAYHTWWIIPADGVDGTASNGLVMRGHVIQRGYVMGNYSRFVRPGSFRINATENPSDGVYTTAYRNDSLGQISIVAINENDYATEQSFQLNNVSVSTFTPWETSEDVKLTDREPVDAGAGFSWTLPATSVVTFVGSYGSGYSLTLETTGQGRVNRDPEEILFEEGTTVTLTAEPDQGWEFVSWSGEGISSSETSIDVTMDSDKAVSALFSKSPDEEGNYVTNGDFSSDSDDWTLNVWDGDASGSVVDGEYEISIESIGSENHQIQLVQPGLFLENGKTYQVSFDAYAESERELGVNVEMADDPWDSYIPEFEYFELTTEKESYSFTFTMEDSTDVNGRLSFNAGSSVEDLYIDNVAVKDYNTPVDSPTEELSQDKGISVSTWKSYIKVDFTVDHNTRADIKLYNLRGKLVKSESVNVDDKRFSSYIFDLNGMASGIYIINLCIGESPVRSEKIIMSNME